MGKPPAPTYATFLYGVFEFFLIKRFGNNLLLYRQIIDDLLALWRRYDKERGAAYLRAFQETIQKWHEPECNLQGPFLKLDFMDLTIDIKDNSITTNLFKNN